MLDRTKAPGVFLRLAAALALLVALGYWMARVPVALYETSLSARIEMQTSPASIQAPITGRIVEARLAMNQIVREGEVLVRLDSLPEQLHVSEERAKLSGIKPRIGAFQYQIAKEEELGQADRQAFASSIEEAEARVRELQAPADAAATEFKHVEELRTSGLVPMRDLERAAAEKERTQRAVDTAKSSVERIRREFKSKDEQRQVRIATIRTEVAKLDAESSNSSAAVQRAGHDVELRLIRAPISGVVGEALTLRTGAVLTEGAKIGTILPDGTLRIVAYFEPRAAFGRLMPGSRARMRLQGYPWMEFGAIEAEIAAVAREDREGKARVELKILKPLSRVNLVHGMPGEVEVEVEQTPPLALVLRTAGQWLTASSSTAGNAP